MMALNRVLQKCFKGCSALLKLCCIAIMALLVIAVGIQVFSRYVLNSPTAWSEPLSQIAFIWLTLFGAAIVTREKGMLYVDILQNRLRGTALKICQLLCNVISLIVSGCWIYSSALQISNTWEIMEGGLPIRRGWIYIGILVAFVFMFLFIVEDSIRLLSQWRAADPERNGEQ